MSPPDYETGPHLPLHLPDPFLTWLGTTRRLTPRQRDLVRCRARLMVPKEIAAELGLAVASVRRMQATLLHRLRLHDGERGLLRWLAAEFARWEREHAV